MLIHRPQMSEIFQQARQIGVTQEPSIVVNFPHHEQGDANRFVTERRRTQNVGDNQQSMMGFAWTIPSEKKYVQFISKYCVCGCNYGYQQ